MGEPGDPGIQTVMCTDVEGSTELTTRRGDAVAQRIIHRQYASIVDELARHGGREVDNAGDGVMAVFGSARRALECAVAIHEHIARDAAERPEEAVRVRIALSAGELVQGHGKPFGAAINQAARIAGHTAGGEILVSDVVRQLAGTMPGLRFRDRGRFEMKGFAERARLYQVLPDTPPAGPPPPAAPPRAGRRRRRRGRLAIAAAVCAALAAAAAVLALARDDDAAEPIAVADNALAVIDPEGGRLLAEIPVGALPGDLAAGGDSMWVANTGDDTVSRVDRRTRRVVATVTTGQSVSGLAAGPAGVWASDAGDARARRIETAFGQPAERARLSAGGDPFDSAVDQPSPVAVGRDGVWLADGEGAVVRLDATTGRRLSRVVTGNQPAGLALSSDALWVADDVDHTLLRVDRETGAKRTPIPVQPGAGAVAVGAGGVWVAERLHDSVTRIDPGTNAAAANIAVGRAPSGLAILDGRVWVANSLDGTLSEIDPEANRVVRTLPVGGSPSRIAVADGALWVTVQPLARAASAAGTLRIVSRRDFDFVDPGLSYDTAAWQAFRVTCAMLVTYPDAGGTAGTRLVPEVARTLPSVSGGGLRYTFRIRPGYRFSPPSGAPVTARTFKDSIERSLSPRWESPARGFLPTVVGAEAYSAGRARHIAGIVARGDTLTIRLTSPTPDLLYKLALPFFCAVPSGTPVRKEGVALIPMAGPYRMVSYTPDRQFVLERNPSYRGPRPRRMGRIEWTFGVGLQLGARRVLDGKADFARNLVASRDVPALARRLGADSPAARRGRQQLFVNPVLGQLYFAFNTSRPTFADARVRGAANLALDRAALVRVRQRSADADLPGALSRPTDQYLLPGVAGYRDRDVYPLSGPDVAAARRLMDGRRRTAVMLHFGNALGVQEVEIVRRNLRAIGIDVRPRNVGERLFGVIGTRGEEWDITWTAWVADFPDPATFIDQLFDGRTITATNNSNWAYFDDPAYNRRIANASRLTGAARARAYARLDDDLTRKAAPYAAYATIQIADLFSARIGCQVFHPIYQIDLGALCLR